MRGPAAGGGGPGRLRPHLEGDVAAGAERRGVDLDVLGHPGVRVAARGSPLPGPATRVRASCPSEEISLCCGASTARIPAGSVPTRSGRPVRKTRPAAPRATLSSPSGPSARVRTVAPARGVVRLTRTRCWARSRKTRPSAPSGTKRNGTPEAAAIRRVVPSGATSTSAPFAAATTAPPTGTAELTSVASFTGAETVPAAASTVRSRLSTRVADGSSTSLPPNCVNTAVSPAPQPGLKYANELCTGSLRTAPVPRSTTAVNPPRSNRSASLVKVRGA
ncbi:hypothetical protein KIF24_31760 [Micromonospora sp. Llam7]|uniref:hypothetical protein n=1 Tax=Micromonospora tarapacensis TaxID=2835305 RepID=UPI001C839C19|nr:hypothetical protein [Micromonospora tarapacensis]MBX7270150.1 hypothetical protein [Micromonospora tarapacensis]